MKKLLLPLCILTLLFSCDSTLLDRAVEVLILPTPEISIEPLFEEEVDPEASTEEFYSPQRVTLSCQEEADIHYEVVRNGVVIESGIYINPILLGGPDNDYSISAVARLPQRVESNKASGNYSVYYSQLDPPLFYQVDDQGLRSDLPGSTYSEALDITLICPTVGARIYYTLNGSEPQPPGADDDPEDFATLYDGPIEITGHGTSVILKAYSRLEGYSNSLVTEAFYLLDYPMLEPPVPSHETGNHPYDFELELNAPENAPEGYEIYYSLSLDSAPHLLYQNPIPVEGLNTELELKAEGRAPGYQNSREIAQAYRLFQDKTDSPEVSYQNGAFQFRVGQGELDQNILIFVSLTSDGSQAPMPYIEGQCGALPEGVDSEEYSIGPLTFYKIRNGSTWDVSNFSGTLNICAQAVRPELNSTNPESVVSQAVYSGPHGQ